MSVAVSAGRPGPTCSRSTQATGHRAPAHRAARGGARSRRSRSAGCSSVGARRREPSTPAAAVGLRRAAERVETALTGLEEPLKRYLLELEAEAPRGARGTRAGCRRAPRLGAGADARGRPRRRRERVAQAYLELAVLVRALEGLPPRRGSRRYGTAALWAGLFDLQDTCSAAHSTTSAPSPA